MIEPIVCAFSEDRLAKLGLNLFGLFSNNVGFYLFPLHFLHDQIVILKLDLILPNLILKFAHLTSNLFILLKKFKCLSLEVIQLIA
jgi:hypothetical protein